MNENIDCCKYCRFFKSAPAKTGFAEGYCRKNPPTFTDNGFPRTQEDWWCGSFSVRWKISTENEH